MSGWSVDGKRVTLSAPLRSGNADAVCVGTAGEKRYLVTLSTKHAESFEAIQRRMRIDVAGVAPLAYVGPSDEGCPYPDALVEEITTGFEAKPTIREDILCALGSKVAKVVASVHQTGGVLAGIRPELIYVDDHSVFTTLVPRGPSFAASAPMPRGVRTYAMPYMAPETYLENEITAAGDIFALAESLWFLATGAHPFGDEPMAILNNLAANQVAEWTRHEKLGVVLKACLVPAPAERPSAEELSRLLFSAQIDCTPEHHINGRLIGAADSQAIGNAFFGWADRIAWKLSLLVDRGNFEAEIYGDEDEGFLVSACVGAEPPEVARALLLEFIQRLEAAGIQSSFDLQYDDGTWEQVHSTGYTVASGA